MLAGVSGTLREFGDLCSFSLTGPSVTKATYFVAKESPRVLWISGASSGRGKRCIKEGFRLDRPLWALHFFMYGFLSAKIRGLDILEVFLSRVTLSTGFLRSYRFLLRSWPRSEKNK